MYVRIYVFVLYMYIQYVRYQHRNNELPQMYSQYEMLHTLLLCDIRTYVLTYTLNVPMYNTDNHKKYIVQNVDQIIE